MGLDHESERVGISHMSEQDTDHTRTAQTGNSLGYPLLNTQRLDIIMLE